MIAVMIEVMTAMTVTDCNDGYSQTAAVINITSVIDDINMAVDVYTAETRTVMTAMTAMTIIMMHACSGNAKHSIPMDTAVCL